MEPEEGYYYIYPASNYAGTPQPGLFSIEIQHAKIEQVNSDLYISPDGDNNNSGLTPDDPLQSIAFALAKIRSDSLQHKTIHIADGVYSSSLNGQYFPLHLKSHVSIIGESRENTILDAELYGGHIYAYDPQRDYSIKNLKLINSRNMKNITIGKNINVIIDNIWITQHHDNLDDVAYYAFATYSTDFSLNKMLIEENFGAGALYLYTMNDNPVLNMTNCVFRNNFPSCLGCIQVMIGRGTLSSDSLIVNMINTEITGNLDETVDWSPSTVAIRVDFECKVNIINSTIGNNETTTGAALVLASNSVVTIINSILYGTIPREIFLDGRNGTNTLNVKNSLVSGGIWDVGQLAYNNINWDESTTLDEDPLWQNSGEFPYSLSPGSPCIDAGTLELPPGIELPEFDLAGNPRIYGDTIDMGAYEWQGTPVENYELGISN